MHRYESDVGKFVGAEPLETDTFKDTWTALERRLACALYVCLVCLPYMSALYGAEPLETDTFKHTWTALERRLVCDDIYMNICMCIFRYVDR